MNKYLEKIAKVRAAVKSKKRAEDIIDTLSSASDAHDGYRKIKKHYQKQRRKLHV